MKKWQKAVLLSGLALGMVACGIDWKDMDKYVVTDKADNKIIYRGLGADTATRVMEFGNYGELYNYLMPGDTIAGAYLNEGYYISDDRPLKYGGACKIDFVNGHWVDAFIIERRGIMIRDSVIVDMRGRRK